MKVSELKKLEFRSLKFGDQLELKNNGRPMPHLNIVQVQKKCKSKGEFTRKFDKSIYNKVSWLCGCEETNAFFCFLCLLLGGDNDDNWTKEGVTDLKHLNDKIRKHENSIKHRDNLVSFKIYGKTNIAACVSEAYANEVHQHNETVKKNRHVLSKMIDIIKFCASCNLPLCGPDETDTSKNRGVFLEIVDFTSKIDLLLHNHMQDARVFQGTSKTTQNELLQCMLEVCRNHILNEIKNSSFVALMADDTTDVSTQTQTVLLLRYELNGKIFERFWGFENTERQDVNDISEYILDQINPILKNQPNKLIAQTYDGVAIMYGQTGGVSAKIKETYEHAHFVYCYAHKLNKLLEQATSTISSVKIFFGNLKEMSAFFSHSPDRTAALDNVCNIGISRLSQTRWNFHSCIVQTVSDHIEEISKCFTNIKSGVPKKYNNETTTKAAGFLKWLEDETFLYWLNFFNKIIPYVDVLSNQLQKINTDATKIEIALDNFYKIITEIRNGLPPKREPEDEPVCKLRKTDAENLDVSAREVCDSIIFQIRERFGFKNHFIGANLFLRKNYSEYKKNVPLAIINQFCDAFPMLDRDDLKNELIVFYSRPELIANKDISGCLKTLNFIYVLGLEENFKEITKSLQILVTIPMITSETERCFSSLKNIKTFLRSSKEEDRLIEVGMLSIEKQMVHEIEEFNEKVIGKFICDETRRIDFHYKK